MNNVIPLRKNDDDIIANKLSRYMYLKDFVKEYEQLRKELKKSFEARAGGADENCEIVGEYKVSGKTVIKKSFVMPESMYWDMRVKKI